MEKTNNEYQNLMIKLNEFKRKNSFVKPEEMILLSQLDRVVEEDKNGRIIEELLSKNPRLSSLLKNIENQIAYYRGLLEQYRDDKTSFIQTAYNNMYYVSILGRLTTLKDSIMEFMADEVGSTLADEQEIIQKALQTFNNGHFEAPKYFGQTLARKVNDQIVLNKDAIDVLYDSFQNKPFIGYVVEGVALCEREKYYQSRLEACEEANSYREAISEKMPVVKQMASLNEFLEKLKKDRKDPKFDNLEEELSDYTHYLNRLKNQFFFRMTHLRQYERVKQHVQDLQADQRACHNLDKNISVCEAEFNTHKKALSYTDIAPIIERMSMESSEARPDFSIEKAILTFTTMDDFDAYYRKIERERENASTKLAETKEEASEFLKENPYGVRDLLREDYETASNISSFYKDPMNSEISPEIALFALKLLVTLRDLSSEDMEFSEDDRLFIKGYLEDVIQGQCDSFEEEYKDIFAIEKPVQFKKEREDK